MNIWTILKSIMFDEPQEITLTIFNYLSLLDVSYVGLVCKTLHEISEHHFRLTDNKLNLLESEVDIQIRSTNLPLSDIDRYHQLRMYYAYREGNVKILSKSRCDYLKLAKYGHSRMLTHLKGNDLKLCMLEALKYNQVETAKYLHKLTDVIDVNTLDACLDINNLDAFMYFSSLIDGEKDMYLEYFGIQAPTIQSGIHQNERLLSLMCQHNKLDLIKTLSKFDGNAISTSMLFDAIICNHLDLTEYLIDYLKPDNIESLITRVSSHAMLKLLLNKSKSEPNTTHLWVAYAMIGDLELLKTLPCPRIRLIRPLANRVANNMPLLEYLIENKMMDKMFAISICEVALVRCDAILLSKILCSELVSNDRDAFMMKLTSIAISSHNLGLLPLFYTETDIAELPRDFIRCDFNNIIYLNSYDMIKIEYFRRTFSTPLSNIKLKITKLIANSA